MLYDICIHSGASIESGLVFANLYREMLKRGKKILLYTSSKKVVEFWNEEGIKDYIILPEERDDYNLIDIENFLNENGIVDPKVMYRSESIMNDLTEEKGKHLLYKRVDALMRLDLNKIAKIYLTEAADFIEHNIFMLLAKRAKGKMLFTGLTILPNKIFINDSLEKYWKINTIPLFSEIPEKSKSEINEYINSYINKEQVLWSEVKLENHLINHLKISKNKFKNISFEKVKYYLKNLKRDFFRQVDPFFSKNVYTNSIAKCEQNNFFYFPLHVPRDSQLTLRGLPFYNQISFIEIFLRYLPQGYKLIIKEHPRAPGWIGYKTLKRLKNMPNVIIANPAINSHELIKRSSGIIVINSSVGFEALLYQKPVITLGKSFYREKSLTIDVNSLFDFEHVFEKVRNFKVDREQLISFIYAMHNQSYSADYLKLYKNDIREVSNLADVLKQISEEYAV